MKVIFFGFYDPDYARNRVLIKGLRQNGVEVLECRDDSTGIKKFFRLFSKFKKLEKNYDLVVVGFLGHQVMLLTKVLTRKPVIFDAFISLYDTNIFDRKVVSGFSPRAGYYYLLDWFSMKLADLVLFDTKSHADYISRWFSIEPGKFRWLFVGSDDEIFYPRPQLTKLPNQRLKVFFHGNFIPLQGIEFIVQAAKILEAEEIDFEILGRGQTYSKIKKLADSLTVKNLTFLDRVDYQELPGLIAKADICLGIFGATAKAGRVIPNKVYEYTACRKPVITADTLAIRELFSPDDLFLIKPADSQVLAGAIKQLQNDQKRLRLAENGYQKFISLARPKIVGAEFKRILEEIVTEPSEALSKDD